MSEVKRYKLDWEPYLAGKVLCLRAKDGTMHKLYDLKDAPDLVFAIDADALAQQLALCEERLGRLRDCPKQCALLEWNKAGGCLFCNLQQAEAQLAAALERVKESRMRGFYHFPARLSPSC